jgi:hypothetical protein
LGENELQRPSQTAEMFISGGAISKRSNFKKIPIYTLIFENNFFENQICGIIFA